MNPPGADMGQTGTLKPRRPYRTGSIEDRGNGTYRLRVLFPDPATGRLVRRSKTVHAPTRGAKRFLEDELGKFRTEVAQRAVTGSKAPLSRLLDEWVGTLGGHLSPKTQESYVDRVENQIRPALGAVRLDQLTAHRIDLFYAALRGQGLKPRTVQLVHAVLRSVLELGVDWGWIVANPMLKVRRPRIPKEEKVALTVAQVGAIYEAATDPMVRCAIGLAALTGVRRGEACGLKWSDIAEDGTVSISRAWVPDAHGQHLSPTKSGMRRLVVLGALGEEMVEQYRAAQLDTWGKLGEWLLSDGDGADPLRARVLTTAFAGIVRSLGIKATFHDLRHFADSLGVAIGVDPVSASRRSGHSPEVMMAVYAHGTLEQDQRAAEMMSAALTPMLAPTKEESPR